MEFIEIAVQKYAIHYNILKIASKMMDHITE